MKQYIVDAFTDQIFSGNPAAICILSKWIDEKIMQAITIENNLSETAFAVKEGDKYHLRWFTPGGEIDLCGHATLACAYVLMNYYEKDVSEIVFSTMSGDLTVRQKDNLYEMEFPAYELHQVKVTADMSAAYGVRPIEAYLGRDLLCVFSDESEIKNMNPDMDKLKSLDGLIQHATAKGEIFDCVSRSFAPKLNIKEDPVCGSGHCHIVPYWSGRIGNRLTAYQASNRGGILYCQMAGDKVQLSGHAVLYSIADLMVKD